MSEALISGQCSPAHSGEQTGESKCESIASPKLVAEASAAAVSPAISHAAANGREPSTTESNASKSCNKSGSQSEKLKPNCYECVHRGAIPGNAHSRCKHPSISEISEDPLAQILGMLGSRGLARSGVNLGMVIAEAPNNPLGISGNSHGIESGWFNWPINFDPVWLESCNGFERKEQ